MIAYRATLDVPRELAQFTARLLVAERRRRGTPRGSRALTCFWQAVLGLRWFRGRVTPDALARDHGISRATAYRYVEEVIAVLADQAPDLREALERARDEGFPHVILDGTIISADRCREKTVSVQGELIDVWYSGKAHTHGGNIQAVIAPDGSRCGYRSASRARCMTSQPPASTPCPRCTGPPPPGCPPWLTPAMRARHRHPHPRQAARGRAGARYRHSHPQRPSALSALPGRTRIRAAHRALAHPAAHHRQPQQDQRHRPGRARPHPFRVRLHQMKIAEITSFTQVRGLWRSYAAGAAGCGRYFAAPPRR